MTETSQEVWSKFTLPDNFIVETLIMWPTAFFVLKPRIERYNEKFWTKLDAIQVANHLVELGYQILTIPEESDSDVVVSDTTWEVNNSLDKDWKDYVSKEVLDDGWGISDAELEIEVERVVNILLGADIELNDSDKEQYDFIIDFFVKDLREMEEYRPLKTGIFQQLDSKIEMLDNNWISHWLMQIFRGTTGLSLRSGVEWMIYAYREKVLDDKDSFYNFVRKAAFISKYIWDISCVLDGPQWKEQQEQDEEKLQRIIIPEMQSIALDWLDESNVWPESHISFLLYNILYCFAEDYAERKPQEWDVKNLSEYIIERIYQFDSHIIDIWKSVPQVVSERLPSWFIHEESYRPLIADVYRYFKYLLNNSSIDIWDLFTYDDICELNSVASSQEAEQARKMQDERIRKDEERAEKRVERFASKDSALQYMFWRISWILEETKWNIQEAVIVLKENPNSDFSKLITRHNINAIDLVEYQLAWIDWAKNNRWYKRNQTDWQKVCSVLAEFKNIGTPIIPNFLQANSDASRIALSIMRYDKAETISHLPDGVYDNTLDSYFQNVSRVERKQEADSRERDRRMGYDDGFMDFGSTDTSNTSSHFYKFTSAIPAWWLTPDWKKLVLLKDDIWTDIKKTRIRATEVLGWFDTLIAQCDRRLKILDTLKKSKILEPDDEIDSWDAEKASKLRVLFQGFDSDLIELAKGILWNHHTKEFVTEHYDTLEPDMQESVTRILALEEQYNEIQREFKNDSDSTPDKNEDELNEISRNISLVHYQKGLIKEKRKLFEEQFIWTRQQRDAKRERLESEREDRQRRSQLFGESVVWRFL